MDRNLEAEASHVGALKRDIERLVPYVNAGGLRAKCVAMLDATLVSVLGCLALGGLR